MIEGTTAPMALPVPTEPEQPGRKRSNRVLDHVDTVIGPNARGKRKPQQPLQKSLNRSGAMSVYLTVC